MHWWRLAHCAPSHVGVGFDSGPHSGTDSGTCRHDAGRHETRGQGGRGSLGVRRPLRFLAWKLELDDEQLAEVARILAELKTERAQGEVDRARRAAAFADAVAGASFDRERAAGGAALHVAEAERLREVALAALAALHAALDEDQRRTLATLIRSGSFAL
jgi:hypothetical protein